MRHRHALTVVILTASLALAGGRPAAGTEGWPPITMDEEILKDCPQQPGAPAVFLYREEIANANTGITSYFRRLKVLTAAGKERANIEIPFYKGFTKIKDLKARVVRPDGTSTEFTGQVFDKTALRAGGFKAAFKTFALPNVDVGSIIDYRYAETPDEGGSLSTRSLEAIESLIGPQGKPPEGGVDTEEGVLFFPIERWDIQEDLFTRRAKFSYEPSDIIERLFSLSSKGMRLNWVSFGLEGAAPARKEGRIELVLDNIPAFEAEEYMSPASKQQKEVRIFYLEGSKAAPELYWKEESKNWQKGVDKFMKKSGDAAAQAQTLLADIGDPLMKIRALYARAQDIKNLSYDRTMTSQRRKELKIKYNRSVADVLKNNYGLRSDITRTFVALARAAGFEARVLRVSARDDKFFDMNLCDLYEQFDTELAMVKVNGGDKLFDPGTPLCPIGLVRWSCTGTTSLCPSDKPPLFLTTPSYPADLATTVREFDLRLDLEGNLKGTVKVRYSGQEALVRRLAHINDDELEVKKAFEAELGGILPSGSGVSLKKIENMTNSTDNVRAEFEISLPGLATAAGERTLLPVSPLLGDKQHPFRHAKRKYPVCFPYPYRVFDDIVVSLPSELKAESTPRTRKTAQEAFGYSLLCAVENGTKIHVQRDLSVKKNYFPLDQYAAVKGFFDEVRAGDEEQVVLVLEKKRP